MMAPRAGGERWVTAILSGQMGLVVVHPHTQTHMQVIKVLGDIALILEPEVL